MDKLLDSILCRIEARGYRLAMISAGGGLTVQAYHPATGQLYAVRTSASRRLDAANELAGMVGVRCDDLLAAYRPRPLPVDDPQMDESAFPSLFAAA